MNRRIGRFARIAPFLLLALALPMTAVASVRKEGAWPASDRKVSFDFEGKPSDGISKLASEAGWSLVLSKGIAVGEHDVKIDVDDQPADAVLEALFSESKVIARRSGSLVTITPDDGRALDTSAAPLPPPPPSPPALPSPPSADGPAQPAPAVPPVPTVRGQDRNIVGNSVVIGKDEIVHTVTVTGGSAKILGTVTGDLVVAGGSAKIESGARVIGNATVFGGSLKVEKGARVDGDVGIVGGSLKREEGAVIGGKVVDNDDHGHGQIKVSVDDGNVSTAVEDHGKAPARSRIGQAAHDFGQSITRMALLFVLGCMLLALANRKMESLRLEAAARPMRSFAMGIVGALGAVTAVVVACITIVGIPFAAMAVLLGAFALYGAIAAVLTTVGAAMLQHRTKNPYAHLLAGCAAFLLVGAIPYLGGLVTFVLTMIAIGTLVSTRLGGIGGRPPKPDLV